MGRRRTRLRKRRGRRTRKLKGGSAKSCLFINWDIGIGIGNQLCIYAAAVRIKNALKHWDICIPPLKQKHSDVDYRYLFKQGIPVERDDERIGKAGLVHSNIQPWHDAWNTKDLVAHSGNIFQDPTKNIRLKSVTEEGYYHNYSSIAPAIDSVRTDILEELSKQYGGESGRIKNPSSSAFLHIRHGDYAEWGVVADKSYYIKGLQELEKTIEDIYIISTKEGIEWANSEEILGGATRNIHIIDDDDELKVLYLMSLCKAGACISPSTYSMWGAILGPQTNAESRIFYPSKWLNHDADIMALPAEWTRID